MGKLYNLLGLTVAAVQSDMSPEELKAAYACDVTYVTGQELGFSYLRDNTAGTVQEVRAALLLPLISMAVMIMAAFVNVFVLYAQNLGYGPIYSIVCVRRLFLIYDTGLVVCTDQLHIVTGHSILACRCACARSSTLPWWTRWTAS